MSGEIGLSSVNWDYQIKALGPSARSSPSPGQKRQLTGSLRRETGPNCCECEAPAREIGNGSFFFITGAFGEASGLMAC
ncbi:hypothetical protein GN956_G20473 [Arapaima gigas]